MRTRRWAFRVLSEIFEQYGYEPLETPAVELLSVLTGKYGEEGDKLLFRILNSGDFLADVPEPAKSTSSSLLPYIAEKALRYDLTVPMARWVAQHAGELVFPFKRYQIQPVWRADRPQRGRFREFYQCDVDIIGAEGIIPLSEIIDIARRGLQALGIHGAVLHLNHRKLLEHAAQEVGWHAEHFSAFCGRLDKVDKIGWAPVVASFKEEGYILPTWLNPEEGFSPQLRAELQNVPALREDVEALHSLISGMSDDTLAIRWDSTLARGLEYYTGYIYEIRVPNSGVGSIAAGGAYASLVSDFGGPDLPAMGLSFGIERILTLLEPRHLSGETSAPILVAWIDASPAYVQRVVQVLHRAGLSGFAFPAPKKLSKQIEYAQRRGWPIVAIVGAQEESTETVLVKYLAHHVQKTVPLSEVAEACR